MGSDPLQQDEVIGELRLFHTGDHPCGYWPERNAR